MGTQQLSEHNHRTWLAYRADLRARQSRPDTIRNYFETLQDADRALKQPFQSCTRLDIKSYLGECTERLADTTVRGRWVVLKVFYNWMVREELITSNPMNGIGEPTVIDNPPRIIPVEDIKALLKSCSGTSFRDRRDNAIFRLMLEPGGPRRAEITFIKLDDLDIDHEIVTIHGKGGKTRYIPYGAKTSQALLRYLHVRQNHKDAKDDALWLGRFGALSLYALTQILESRCAAAGITRIKPHDLRHFTADQSMSAGISDLDLQTLFGWSSPRMLAVYARSNRTARAIESARQKAIGDRL